MTIESDAIVRLANPAEVGGALLAASLAGIGGMRSAKDLRRLSALKLIVVQAVDELEEELKPVPQEENIGRSCKCDGQEGYPMKIVGWDRQTDQYQILAVTGEVIKLLEAFVAVDLQ